MKALVILERDPSSRYFMEAVLERDYRVVVTDSVEHAIRLCEFQAFDLFISDNQFRLPLSGLRTLCRIHERHPQLPLLIVSATPPEGWSDIDFHYFGKLVNTARLSFLQKPFNSDALRKELLNLMRPKWSSGKIRALHAGAEKHRTQTES